jgi:hypothetical protein
MAEEHITTVDPARGGATHTTIVTDGSGRRSGAGWLIGIVLLIAVIAGIWLFSQSSGSEAVKDNAIANAAGQVGDAAQKAGDAAQDAANTLKK